MNPETANNNSEKRKYVYFVAPSYNTHVLSQKEISETFHFFSNTIERSGGFVKKANPIPTGGLHSDGKPITRTPYVGFVPEDCLLTADPNLKLFSGTHNYKDVIKYPKYYTQPLTKDEKEQLGVNATEEIFKQRKDARDAEFKAYRERQEKEKLAAKLSPEQEKTQTVEKKQKKTRSC